MAKRRKEVLSSDIERVSDIPANIENIIYNDIDDLLGAELMKIEDLSEPGKSSMTKNLKQYYDAQRRK